MGINSMLTSDIQAPQSDRVDLPLFPSEQSDSWQEIINLRLQANKAYQFYKLRGGTTVKQTLDGNVLSMHGFSSSVNGSQTDYLAVHTVTGSVYLIDKATHIDPGSPAAVTKIYDGVFTTTGQVKFINNGIFLYIFDFDSELYKVYNIEEDVSNDWMGTLSGSIIDYSWKDLGLWTDENIWGIREGADIIAMNSFTGADYLDPLAAEQTFRSFTTKVESVTPNGGYFTYVDPEGTQYKSTDDDMIGVIPNSPDLQSYLGIQASLIYDQDTSSEVNNDEFSTPILWRGYLVVDLLSDGSYALPGRPITVSTSMFQLVDKRQTALEFYLNAAPDHVDKRLLFCTRWQVNPRNVFIASRPEYDNSAFFFVKEIETSSQVITDATPDNQLFNSISSFLNYRGGINQQFGKGQVSPQYATGIESSLLMANYKINRPVPEIYTDKPNADEKNSFISVGSGTNLTSDPTVKLIFEYSDGKKSDTQEHATPLTDAEESISPAADGAKASASFDFSDGGGAASAGTVGITYEGVSVSINYTASMSKYDAMYSLYNAINTDGDINLTAGVTGLTLTLTEKRYGSSFNTEVISISNTGGTHIAVSDTSISLSGGQDSTEAELVSANKLILHSLNALVSAVYVILDRAGTNYLYKEIQPNDGYFHGRVLRLPNTDAQINELDTFTEPAAANVRESVQLFDYLLSAIPFQQPLINEQARVDDSTPIKCVIPTQFDVDKNAMRKRVVIFTEQGIQVGYLVFGDGVTYDFEPVPEGSVLTHKFGAAWVHGAGGVIYQATDGIYRLTQSSHSRIIDTYRYDNLSTDLQGVLFNRQHKEYWLFFGDTEVIITNSTGEVRKRFSWSHPVQGGAYIGDQLVLGIADDIAIGDVDSANDDGTDITGTMVSSHIGGPKTQSKVMEVTVAGQDLSCDVALDLQRPRLEENNDAWSDGFTSDKEVTGKTLYMHGTPFTFSDRGVMPKARIQVQGDNDGFISHILLTHILLENKGKAR